MAAVMPFSREAILKWTAWPYVLSGGVILLVVAIERALGRIFTCACGYVSLWSGDITSSSNSQQWLDPYSFSHILHGFIFFLFLWLLAKRWPLSIGWRFFLAAVFEATWEVWENTSFIIDRYREATIAYNYYGDSIINSFSDIVVALLGFWLAYKLPWRLTLIIALAIEATLFLVVHDSLGLNILMLVYPIPSLKTWQAGA
jgi:hypothetical protein